MSTEELKDYLKYYLGCEVHAKEGTMTYTLRQLGDDGKFALFKDKHGNEMWLPPNEWKLCLRKLSSITEEEAIECARLVAVSEEFTNLHPYRNQYNDLIIVWSTDKWNSTEKVWSAEQFHYLLSSGFWLFGDEAFEKGLIIEKK